MSTAASSPLSIAARLALAVTVLLLVGGIGVSLMAYAYGRQSADAAYDRVLLGAAFEVSRAISIVNGQPVVDLPISAFELLALAPDDRIAYRVVGVDGATITGDEWVPLPPRKEVEPVYYGERRDGADFRFVATGRRFAERSFKGDVTVIVGHTTQARAILVEDITTKALAVVLAAGVIISVIAFLALRSALRPLTAVEAALRSREPTDLTPLDVQAPRELSTVVTAVNRFMARLDERVQQMQTLIGDASHQLKTPIAALRLQAEMAMQEDDPDRLRDMVTRIHRRSGNLARLAEQMLSEAMIIHRADSVPRLPIDLRKLAIEVTEDADHFATASASEALALDLPEDPVMVEADAPSVTEAARNLINNAYRYGKPPIRVSITSDPQAREARLTVSDRGHGFAEARDDSAGHRFQRYAGAHHDSAGLGLAIVRAVARAHGGRLEFGFLDSGDFAAHLVLPLEVHEEPVA